MAGPRADVAPMTDGSQDGAFAGMTLAQRRLSIVTVLIALFVAALDQTIVATALPTITQEFGELSGYSWIFAAYLLTETATIPLWGRAADIHGIRRMLLVGLGVFLLGSVLCAAATSMLTLSLARALQPGFTA